MVEFKMQIWVPRVQQSVSVRMQRLKHDLAGKQLIWIDSSMIQLFMLTVLDGTAMKWNTMT